MISFTSPRAILTGFVSTIPGSVFASVLMNLPVTIRVSFVLDPMMECKYAIDVIFNCIPTVRFIERGGRERGLPG